MQIGNLKISFLPPIEILRGLAALGIVLGAKHYFGEKGMFIAGVFVVIVLFSVWHDGKIYVCGKKELK